MEEEDEVVGYVLGDKKVTVSKVNIDTATRCLIFGVTYSKNWANTFNGITVAQNAPRHPRTPFNFPFKTVLMRDEARVLNQILNKAILHKDGSKDSILDLHTFLMTHLIGGHKINLPYLLFERFKEHCIDVVNVKTITFAILLSRIFEVQGVYMMMNDLPPNMRAEFRIAHYPSFSKANLS